MFKNSLLPKDEQETFKYELHKTFSASKNNSES